MTFGSDKKGEGCTHGDSIVIGPPISDEAHLCVRHTADHQLAVGVVRPVRDGEPIGDSAVTLEPKGGPLYAVRPTLDPAKGPAKIATRAYRDGWDSIFGKRQPIGEA